MSVPQPAHTTAPFPVDVAGPAPRALTSLPDAPVVETRPWQRRLTHTALGVDVCAVVAVITVLLVVNAFHIYGRPLSLGLVVILPVAWVVALALGRAYEPRMLGTGAEEFRRLIASAFGLMVVIALLSFGLRLQVSRGLVVAALPCALVLDLVGRYAVRKWLHARRRAGACMRRVLLVGTSSWVDDVAGRMARTPHVGLQPVGCCLPEGPAVRGSGALPTYGDYDGIVEAVQNTGATVVAVSPSERMEPTALRRLAWDLEKHRAEIVVSPNLVDCVGPRIRIRPVDGLPLLEVEQPRLSGPHRILKSCIDRLLALSLLVLLAPLLVALAIAVRATSEGPALFRQPRIGAHGREFQLLKFRTMHTGAEQRIAELAAANESDGALFKMHRDPRVTRLGRWLRHHSLDELPQLINVLRGQMSVVGPRPPLPGEVSRYEPDVRRRLMVRPGLTGLWQVSGRSDLTWHESVRLDLFYVENWSLALDVMILWKTVPAVISGRGAY
ncbi:MAG TPA: sugar transferase [Nocardioidaceae bacterium]|nr:sugar transferase [Nocardioidaceae bacterium]